MLSSSFEKPRKCTKGPPALFRAQPGINNLPVVASQNAPETALNLRFCPILPEFRVFPRKHSAHLAPIIANHAPSRPTTSKSVHPRPHKHFNRRAP
jgi:hypothetical protein